MNTCSKHTVHCKHSLEVHIGLPIGVLHKDSDEASSYPDCTAVDVLEGRQ